MLILQHFIKFSLIVFSFAFSIMVIALMYVVKVKVKSLSHVWLCHPVDCSPPGSSVHMILQERILEWVAISFSRGSSHPRDRTQVSCIAGSRFNLWATREALLSNYIFLLFLISYGSIFCCCWLKICTCQSLLWRSMIKGCELITAVLKLQLHHLLDAWAWANCKVSVILNFPKRYLTWCLCHGYQGFHRLFCSHRGQSLKPWIHSFLFWS